MIAYSAPECCVPRHYFKHRNTADVSASSRPRLRGDADGSKRHEGDSSAKGKIELIVNHPGPQQNQTLLLLYPKLRPPQKETHKKPMASGHVTISRSLLHHYDIHDIICSIGPVSVPSVVIGILDSEPFPLAGR